VFASICPTCGELLWVNSHYQRWTCLRCDRRFPKRKDRAPDAIGLVEHLTGCSYYNALWWVIGTGVQPQRKESQRPSPRHDASGSLAPEKPALLDARRQAEKLGSDLRASLD
jgi:hypothetical protein